MTQSIVAYRITTRKGKLYLQPMGQSPRGTRYLLSSIELGPANMSKAARIAEIEKHVTKTAEEPL